MIDVHAHLNFKEFDGDYREVAERAFQQGLTGIINVGSNLATSRRAVAIAREIDACWAAVGLHPIHVQDEKFNEEDYLFLIKENRDLVKAIGETGLDYFHYEETRERQREIFLAQVGLARQSGLPLIIHCRGSRENSLGAYRDLLSLIKREDDFPAAELHCFSADWDLAQEFLALGFYLGFTGPLTFSNASPELLSVAARTPLDRILAETDCPFLTPHPYRGSRNQPAYVRFVVEKIAQLKRIPVKDVEREIDLNAIRLFNLPVEI